MTGDATNSNGVEVELVVVLFDSASGAQEILDARERATRGEETPTVDQDSPMWAVPDENVTSLTLRELGRWALGLEEEIARADAILEPIVTGHAPGLLALHGCGIFVASVLSVAAEDLPERIRSEAAWAHMCGVAPIPAGSGKTSGRHRLNRGGNRQANSALHRTVLTRMRNHEPTHAYVSRRRDEGRSTPEIMRSLKRYVARETFKHLPTPGD